MNMTKGLSLRLAEQKDRTWVFAATAVAELLLDCLVADHRTTGIARSQFCKESIYLYMNIYS